MYSTFKLKLKENILIEFAQLLGKIDLRDENFHSTGMLPF